MNKKLKDHQQIGRELELFFTHEYSPGAPYWLPKGMVIFKELEKYIRELTEAAGYMETSTPIMVKSQLFKESGHWEKFGSGGGNDMYNLSLWEQEEIGNIYLQVTKEVRRIYDEGGKSAVKSPLSIDIKHDNQILSIRIEDIKIIEGNNIILNGISLPVNYTLKPMNCPESTIIYRFRPRSYKELPLRLSELGRLHRREESGEINGLLRVRQMTMDDAHIYSRENQVFDEVSSILDMMIGFYKIFGFEYEFRFATRPDQRAGTDKMWDKAEKDLADVLKKRKIKASDKKGDGAFYGPKIDVHIKDSLNRDWQLATVQLDFHMPEAFDLYFINERGEHERPVMIHRAIFGSFERFIGILTEHFQGKFPLWLSPIQVALLPIIDKHIEHSQKIAEELRSKNIRVEVYDKSDTLPSKIRGATLQKIPYLGIIGDKEVNSNQISVRTRDGEDLGSMDLTQFLQKITTEIEKKV